MPDLTIPQLTDRQARKLIAEINSNIEDVAGKLTRLYYGKGWAALGYTSWKACCQEEFHHSASWACRQIKAAEDRCQLAISADTPESVVRELRKLPEDQRAEAWQDITSRLGDRPTAEQVAHEVDLLTPCDTPPDEQDDSAAASQDEGEPEDAEAERDAGEESVADKEPSLFDKLLDYCSGFHEEHCPEVSLPAFAAVLESVADKIRGMA